MQKAYSSDDFENDSNANTKTNTPSKPPFSPRVGNAPTSTMNSNTSNRAATPTQESRTRLEDETGNKALAQSNETRTPFSEGAKPTAAPSQASSVPVTRRSSGPATPLPQTQQAPNVGQPGDDADAHKTLVSTYGAIEDDLRHTPEYKVAWDLELWRMVQRQRIEKEIKEYRKKLHDEAKVTLLAQEREIKKELERAISELAAKEKAFEEEERKQDRRKTKLLEAEKEMERKSSLLVEHRKRLEDESELRIKRLKADYDHKEDLAQLRIQTLQENAKRIEQRLEASQKEYLKVWEEFAEFRTRTLTNAPSEGIAMERLRTQHSQELILLQERLERQAKDNLAEVARKLEAALVENTKYATIIAQRKEQVRTATRDNAALQAKVASLEQQVMQLREELKATAAAVSKEPAQKSRVDQLAALEIKELRKTVQKTLGRGTSAADRKERPYAAAGDNRYNSPSRVAGLVEVAENNAGGNLLLSSPSTTHSTLVEQLVRWRTERRKLLELGGGAYDEESAVIISLDGNIRRAQERLAALELTAQ